MKTSINTITKGASKLSIRIASAFFIVLFAHSIILVITSKTIKTLNLDTLKITLLESTIITLFIVLAIWVLRTRLDRGKPISIGLNNIPQGFVKFILGYAATHLRLLLFKDQWFYRCFHPAIIAAPVIIRIIDIELHFVAVRISQVDTLTDSMVR